MFDQIIAWINELFSYVDWLIQAVTEAYNFALEAIYRVSDVVRRWVENRLADLLSVAQNFIAVAKAQITAAYKKYVDPFVVELRLAIAAAIIVARNYADSITGGVNEFLTKTIPLIQKQIADAIRTAANMEAKLDSFLRPFNKDISGFANWLVSLRGTFTSAFLNKLINFINTDYAKVIEFFKNPVDVIFGVLVDNLLEALEQVLEENL